jgi:phosphate transport system substrate-binding protein
MWCAFVVLLVCVGSLFASDQKTIVLVGAGSSVPVPLYRHWAEDYNHSHTAIQLNYMPLGTTEGIKQIANNVSDFGAGEVLLTPEERTSANLVELPTALIGIVPIYNLPGAHQDLRFSGELLAEIFLGEVKTWNDPRIAKLNPGVSLPNMPISVVYRPAGKGSNFVFTDFLSRTSPKFRERIGRTPSPKWPVGVPAERSSDMADKVKSSPGYIGYVEYQYADDNHIPFGSVLNPAGKFVKASPESITAACRAVEGGDWAKFAVSLVNAPGADAYPVSSFTWLYVPATAKDSNRAAALKSLLNWMYTDGQRAVAQEGYPALPAPLLQKVKAKANTLH